MGDYNPKAPLVLGQEWVGIRDEDLVFSPAVSVVEMGQGFTLNSSTRFRDARFYTHQLPSNYARFQCATVNIYPAGMEDQSGPIREVIIPVTSGGITGTGLTLVGASSVADALSTPGDSRYLQAVFSGGLQNIAMFFGVNSYPELANKRILNVSFKYAGSVGDSGGPFIDPDLTTPMSTFTITATNGTQAQAFSPSDRSNTGALANLQTQINPSTGDAHTDQTYGYINLGDINALWSPAISPSTNLIRLPWRYVDMQRFEATAGVTRLQAYITLQIPTTALGSPFMRLDYAALRVLYCDEQRVAYGGTLTRYNNGANVVNMYDLSQTVDPVLPQGNYMSTLSWVNPGDVDFGTGTNTGFPELNAIRELDNVPSHPAVQVNLPFPLADRIGATFTKETTHILPQLTLHSSGGPLPQVHVYGRQAKAQVYGSVTATQEIQDGAAGGAGSYPNVRFYAKRYGNTTVPLRLDNPSVTGAGTFVDITPAEFDELSEIVDGWKEVNLRFITSPTMGAGTNPQFRWSATGENVGSRWEVLGVTAPALSGVAGNLLNLVPSPNQLSTATYGQPTAGSTINMGWVPQYAPAVTATADDQTTDAVIMFSQDAQTITGFGVSLLSQAMSGIGQACGVDPCCIPTSLYYHQFEWDLPVNTDVASDLFDRTVAAGSWGDADVGGTWNLPISPADFSVSDGEGFVVGSSSSGRRIAYLDLAALNWDITVDMRVVGNVLAGGTAQMGIMGRKAGDEYYYSSVIVSPGGSTDFSLSRRVGGVNTTMTQFTVSSLNGDAQSVLRMRFMGYGSFLKAKVWDGLMDEPEQWLYETVDTTLFVGVDAGLMSLSNSGAGNQFAYSNFQLTPPSYWFGHYELQRMDTVETDWKAIMKATNPGISTFNDYEARVGILSSYRIRIVDSLGFEGPWSSTVTSTITDPGVVIGCDDGHLLIFTSNEHQDGSINLAYSSVWEGRVQEPFVFPEADFVQLQSMYGKNFFTAFRPTERGGDRFTRTVLVQAAAIDPETLADFRSLRDMAWDAVSYICVRDEDGNRWFATILVPGGNVVHFRKLYMAPVEIIEVTETPSPVNP